MTATHGLAGNMRACTESETFDLGGVANIEVVMEQAFQEPFSIQEMIRITLVVGAGKQARQKYDPQTTRLVTTTLSKLGFQEDRGASCVLECAGMYKLQHDTGKNLKTVVVFPKVVAGKDSGDGIENDHDDDYNESGEAVFFSPKSLEYKIAVCSMAVFDNMVQAKFTTWLEKKALQQFMDDQIVSEIQTCDNLLVKGQQLSPKQQDFYNACSEMDTKQAHLKQSMQTMVEQSQLTQYELDVLLKQIQQRIATLNAQSKPVPKPLLERQERVRHQMTPIDVPKLKHHAELGKLWKQVQPFMHIQESGNLLSVHETKLLGQKNELLEEIHRLELASKGWLEEEQVFEQRVQKCRREFQQKFNIRTPSKGGKSSSGKKLTTTASKNADAKLKVSNTKWVTPGQKFLSQKDAKKKNKMKKGDVFGAMMMKDDDDDSESDDDDHDNDATTAAVETAAEAAPSSSQQQQQPATSPTGGKKSKKKKSKKKKGADSETAALDKAVAQNAALAKKEQEAEAETKSSALPIVILRDYLIPILMALLTWILGLFLGGNKKSKKKKKN